MIAMPSVATAAFNHDSSLLAFMGVQARDRVSDIFYLSAEPSGSATILVPGFETTRSASSFGWSPASSLLLYSVYDNTTGTSVSTSHVVSFSGSTPGMPAQLPMYVGSSYQWVPGTSSVVAAATNRLVAVDLLHPTSDPVLLAGGGDGGGISPYKVSPDGAAVAYQIGHAIGITNIQNPADASLNTINTGSATIGTWQWSPSARFLAVVDSPEFSSSARVNLMRVDGATASTLVPLKLASQSSATIRFAWQPLMRTP